MLDVERPSDDGRAPAHWTSQAQTAGKYTDESFSVHFPNGMACTVSKQMSDLRVAGSHLLDLDRRFTEDGKVHGVSNEAQVVSFFV